MAVQPVLEDIIESAVAISRSPDHQFADFIDVFTKLGSVETTQLATMMVERAATVANADGLDEDYVYLYRDGDINIQVKVIAPEPPRHELCANEFDLILMNISPNDVDVPVYRTSIDSADLTRRPPALTRSTPLTLASHKPVIVPAYGDILDLQSVATPAVLLIFHSAARAATTWVFDRTTGDPISLTSTNLQASRIQIAARLLGAMGSAQDIPTLTALATSGEISFIRWEAAEALYQLDPAAGIAVLRDTLVRDGDRSIRKAAMATLAQLDTGASATT